MDRAVKLTFTAVQLGTMSCYYDFIEVYNGNRDNSPLFWDGRICGNVVPSHSYISYGNKMKVVFEASGFGYNGGFSANYVTNEDRFCGGEIMITNSTEVGYITSPLYPELYPNNTECEWLISSSARANETIYFEFIDFDLEDHATCIYDRLEFSLPVIGKGGYHQIVKF